MRTKTLLASLAVASLAAAQPVAAATRSSESLPVSGVQAMEPADRVGSVVEDADSLRKGRLFWVIIVGGILVAVILLLSGGNDSPG